MPSPAERFRMRAKARKSSLPGSDGPFASFLERHKEREQRERRKRRIFLASLAVHVVVFSVVFLLSAWKVDELFGRRVEVSVVPASQGEGQGADGKPKHTNPTNISRALGLRLVVTPGGSRTEPRGDTSPVSPEVLQQLQPLVLNKLLPALTYPALAKDQQLRGAVTVLVDVDDAGKATALDVKLPCSNTLLCQATKDAVAQLKGWPSASLGVRSFAVPVDYRFE
ncbi:MAG: energy transducer TonB [Deltaproteobacteria bacterium]|nr:energy transducer TonB [Deltaproteobacteria bacterium]